MTTPAKYNHTVSSDLLDVADFQTSIRTSRVDYVAMRAKSNAILGKTAVPWACKCALQGIKIKDGDFVIYKGNKQTDKEFLKLISDEKLNPGYHAKKGGGIEKGADKSVLSVKRLVRAQAANISAVIARGFGADSDIIAVGKAVGLDAKYSFIDSVYGVDNTVLASIAGHYIAFCEAFDGVISEAHAAGHCEGTAKQSHKDAALKYIAYRGLVINAA